jgi:hypothetical protein
LPKHSMSFPRPRLAVSKDRLVIPIEDVSYGWLDEAVNILLAAPWVENSVVLGLDHVGLVGHGYLLVV